MADSKEMLDDLKKLREPFPPNEIGKLPKGGITLDFVGHGYLTKRLLDVDPLWNWCPLAYDESGLPLRDENGGLWIKLTVCGMTRLGYGDGKGPSAIKEAIGDALRNAAMRFGAALDLWCKGDPDAPPAPAPKSDADIAREELIAQTGPYGWTPKKLLKRFDDDYSMDIREADEATVRAFATALVEEAKEQIAQEKANAKSS